MFLCGDVVPKEWGSYVTPIEVASARNVLRSAIGSAIRLNARGIPHYTIRAAIARALGRNEATSRLAWRLIYKKDVPTHYPPGACALEIAFVCIKRLEEMNPSRVTKAMIPDGMRLGWRAAGWVFDATLRGIEFANKEARQMPHEDGCSCPRCSGGAHPSGCWCDGKSCRYPAR